MKIGIDARMLAHSGIGTWIRGLLGALGRDPGPHRYVIWTSPALAAVVPASTAFDVRPSDIGIHTLGEHTRWPLVLRRSEVDLVHVPHYDVPLGFDRPFVVTVHDLIPLLVPEPQTPRWKQTAAAMLLRNAVRRAARIASVSETTRDDLVRRLGVPRERIAVVPGGVEARYRALPRPDVEAFRRQAELPARYLLWIGLRRPHKNVERLVRAYAQARARGPLPDLVLWGKPSGRDPGVEAAIDALGLAGAVHPIARHLPDEHMPLLYNAAEAFVLPSLYEGFGLPPLEAAACGVPVVAARAGALPEILGDAALFVDPHDEAALATALERITADVALRAALAVRGPARAATFDWDRTGAAMRRVYEDAV